MSSAPVDVRKIVENAILCQASEVIIAHNHPSGVAMPSPSDYTATDQVRDALETVGVRLMDHVIVSDHDYVSLRECGYLL